MSVVRLGILGVYSEYAEPAYEVGTVRLLKHQVETWEAFNDPKVDVIFNTAMTGDGKSLAAYLPTFMDGKAVIAMYPTNELIKDQYHALPRYQHNLAIDLPRSALMYGDEITRLMREHEQKVRLEEVRKLLKRNPILLTNPDLIHLMLSHQYGWDYLRKELPVTIGAHFDSFLFDEFHIFGVPQVISVMNMLGYLMVGYRDNPRERKKFVFLSATPSKLMDGLLERGGFSSRRIEGSYCSAEREGYRRILQPCELELHEVSQERSTEVWIQEHLEEIHTFFKEQSGAKAAILVYSVATARRLVALLRTYFGPHGITVGENTGLTNEAERQDSFTKQILVGTSTVDIGVDFHINYLIFEAYSAGSFLQRFGRLGRHDEFETYRAFALLPRFVLERLETKFAAGGDVERQTFNEAVRESFPTEQEFEQYTRRWGVVQAARIVVELQGQSKRDENTAFTDALIEQYERFYGSADKPAMTRAVKTYWRQKKQAPEILDELESFRGQSPLSCGVWDTDDHLKTYDLFFLLANTEFEVMTGVAFMQEVKRREPHQGERKASPVRYTGGESWQGRRVVLEERDFREKLLYLRIRAYVPERLQLVLGLPHDMGAFAQSLHHAQVLNGFRVIEPRHTWLDEVNKKLKGLRLACILSDMGRLELRQRLHLGGMFPLYRLQDATGYEYTVAFGQEALLLDSLLSFRKTITDRPLMC